MSGQNTGQPYAVELLADIRRALGAGHRPKLSALADIVAGLMAEHEALEKVEQAAREVCEVFAQDGVRAFRDPIPDLKSAIKNLDRMRAAKAPEDGE